jgi:hypothetical protein
MGALTYYEIQHGIAKYTRGHCNDEAIYRSQDKDQSETS